MRRHPHHLSLDANATTEVCDAALRAMEAVYRGCGANPSSVHDEGAAARYVVESARATMAAGLGCEADEIVFVASGTEASNLALRGGVLGLMARRYAATRGADGVTPCDVLRALYRDELAPIHVVSSQIEHPAVYKTLEALSSEGLIETTFVAPGRDGIVTAESVAAVMRRGDPAHGLFGTGIVSLMLANNETGAIQPVREVAAVARDYGAIMHSDAVQAVGKIPVDAAALGCDLVSLSAHKFGGPKGVGALVVRGGCTVASAECKPSDSRVRVQPVLHGGGHEFGMRPGTLNVAGIAGMAAALDFSLRDLDERAVRLSALATRIRGDMAGIMPTTRYNSPRGSLCLPNTLNFTLPSWIGASGMDAQEAVRHFASRGISISAASACAAGRGVVASHVLLAQGLSQAEARNSLRVSLPPDAGTQHVEAFFDALIQIAGGWCG